MSTEYRRGIPSAAHVEAATRLGLLWHASFYAFGMPSTTAASWRFHVVNNDVQLDLRRTPGRGPLTSVERNRSYRPIRTDGTPVDWEVLDAEAARAARSRTGPQCEECDGVGRIYGATHDGSRTCGECEGRGYLRSAEPATIMPPAPTAPTTQPQGFRADLWRRICDAFFPHAAGLTTNDFSRVTRLDVTHLHMRESGAWSWADAARSDGRLDILARWAVYQELKPLYDLIDDCPVGRTVPLPADVFQEWARDSQSESVREVQDALSRDPVWTATRLRLASHSHRNIQLGGPYCSWYSDGGMATDVQSQKLHNFAAVLDAVAEQRVAARQGQTEQWQELVYSVQAVLDAPTPATNARILPMPEPRRFSDVRPDRHGWRWWLVRHALPLHQTWLRIDHNRPYDWSTVETVIPTDEQGNPVSWESIGTRQSAAQPTFNNMPIHATTFSNSFNQPLTYEGLEQVLRDMHAIGRASPKNPTGQPPQPAQPTPLPRFTVDELGDVDHSATTTQDSAILKRGKLPTVEAIGKYREVMAKRNSTVAEAVKVSGIDCEVAQYVLERWADGLSDREAFKLIADRYIPNCRTYLRRNIDSSIRDSLSRPTLDTSEPADTAAQQQRVEDAERQARMAALQAQLAKERAARVVEPQEEPTHFSLLEVDEAADPTRSIEAWKAQRERLASYAQRKAIEYANRPLPPPAPHRKPFEVVDAQADGLSGGAAFAVLLSRAMNQNC